MTRFTTCWLQTAVAALACGIGWSQVQGAPPPDEHEQPGACSYSLLHNGPTWDGDTMAIPYDVVANAWARDGAYGGSGRSRAMGFHAGGAGVAVASASYWFKVSHHALPTCSPVKFESDATLDAAASTQIHGDEDDYALATGFQAISGDALRPATLAVAATNGGSPVQQTTVSVAFGAVGFTLTIPGVSVTTDTIDRDRRTAVSWGSKQIEEERIAIHCWTKIKVVTNGPFGGTAWAEIEQTSVSASTQSACPVHQESGSHAHYATEG